MMHPSMVRTLAVAGISLAGAGFLYRKRCLGAFQQPPMPGHFLQTSSGSGEFKPRRWQHALPFVTLCSTREGQPAVQPDHFALLHIAGDGRCLFRALSLGAYLLEHKGLDGLSFAEQTSKADLLRGQVCKELLNRRADLEPFIDEDFNSYVENMQRPHVWGGEPELAVATHVLEAPITVYSGQGRSGDLTLVSQYGHDDYPLPDIPLFFHGAGHYDLLVRGTDTRSRL